MASFIGCMTSQLSDGEMTSLEEAVKENALSRLEGLLQTLPVTTEDLNRRHLLHQAAWLGYPRYGIGLGRSSCFW